MKTDGIYGFYPVVPDSNWVEKLARWGVRTIQLRAKDLSSEAAYREIEKSVEAVTGTDTQLIINDYWAQAIELGCDYIHLGQEDLAACDLTRIKTASLKLGVSTHTQEELDLALKAEPDYIALGPVYETKLKVMPYAPQTLEGVKNWRAQIDVPLVAIGGITLERAPGVLDAGAHSIAVVSDVVNVKDPEARVKEWLHFFEKRSAR